MLLRQLLLCLVVLNMLASVTARLQDISHDEDDDVLSEAITSNAKRTEVIPHPGVGGVNSVTYHKRTDTPLLEELTSSKTPNTPMKNDAASIVGDVNRYGLWEYTADNTGMGEQLKALMKKVQGADIASEMESHDLERQANKMNEQINKYAESTTDLTPTIDPMETPEGYAPTAHPISSSNLYGHNGNIDIITIPNSMTIQDENGNNLDTVKPNPIKEFSRVEPSKQVTAALEGKFPTHSMVINNPTSKQLHRKPVSPTTSLTLKLLHALKSSKTFRNKARKLLSTPSDSDSEVFQKQSKLSAYLKAYDVAKAIENAESKIHIGRTNNVVNMPRTNMIGTVDDTNDNRMLMVIKKLISRNDPYHQRSDLHDLLSSLKSMERDAAKMETQFADTPPSSEQTSGTQEATMSDTYMKHFREFVHKQKEPSHDQQQASFSDDLDHPLGTNSPESPLMGYLVQESAAVSNIKDANDDPKGELQRLQLMMVKQQQQQESMQKVHDKIMLEQFKKLLKEGKESKQDNQKLAEHNGDQKEMASIVGNYDKKFADEVYHNLKNSKEFQDLHAENVLKETGEKQTGSGSLVMLQDKKTETDNSPEKQLKQIELEKEVLVFKEQKLLKLAKEIEMEKHKTLSETNKGKLAKEGDVDHMLHLTHPKKTGKQTSHDDSAEREHQEVHENAEILSNKTSDNDETMQPSTTHSESTHSDFEQHNTKSSQDHESNVNEISSPTEVDKVHNNEKTESNLQTHSKDLSVDALSSNFYQSAMQPDGSKENSSTPSVKQESDLIDARNSTVVKDAPLPLLKDSYEQTDSTNGSSEKHTQDDKHSTKKNERLSEHKPGLPITNPRPKQDDSIEPHAHFHQTYHSKFEQVHLPSEEPSKVISLEHTSLHKSPKHYAPNLQFVHHYSRAPSIMEADHSDDLPPGGMGKPKIETYHSHDTHHVFPIMEPPPLVSYHTDSNHRAVLTDEQAHLREGKPNTFSNLLKKHRNIPSSLSEELITDKSATVLSQKMQLGETAKLIKPHSRYPKIIDVTASKKGFGKLPRKPKSYILKELRRKLELLALKRKLAKHILVKKPNISATSNSTNLFLPHLTNAHLSKHSKHKIIFVDSKRQKNSSVLVPAASWNKIITIHSNNTGSNVIIPGSTSNLLREIETSGRVDPRDVTRSILPATKTSSHTSIEDAFKILGSMIR